MKLRSLILAALSSGATIHASFVDVTEDVLPAYTQNSVPLLDVKKTPMAAGVCVLDANNDGSPDLYFASGQGFPNALMLNDGSGVFQDVSVEWGVEWANNSATTCLAADLDNDGCDDLVVTGAFTGANFTGNLLLKNNYCSDGIASFTDVTPDLLRNWPYTISSSAADFDHDGLLDLYVSSLPALDLSNFPGPAPLDSFPGSSLLLHNRGDFLFEDFSPNSGANNATCPCMTVLMDYDHDGFEDILAINCGNDIVRAFDMQLYRNNGDLTFEDVTDQTGLSGPNAEQGMWMGAGIGDFDHDGCLDVVASNLGTDEHFSYAQPQIIRGQCSDDTKPGFVMEDLDVAPIEGREDLTLFAWGPTARDFDNDGNLDFYWSGNYKVLIHPAFQAAAEKAQNISVDEMEEVETSVNRNDPNRKLKTHSGGEIFYNLGPDQEHDFRIEESPVDLTRDYHIMMTSGDFNGDGALDIVVATDNCVPGPRKGRPLILYGQPNDNHWLGIRLEGTAPSTNPQAIGAVAKLSKKDGSSPTQTLLLTAGSASMSTEEKTLFFGIGSGDVGDYEVAITWPGSGETEFFTGFTEPKIVTLVQGEGATASFVLPDSAASRSFVWQGMGLAVLSLLLQYA